MESLIDRIKSFADTVGTQLSSFEFKDFFDLLIVALLLFLLFRYLKERKIGKLLLGIFLLILLDVAAEIFELVALKYCLNIIFQVGLVAIVVLFQDELRTLLEKIGGASIKQVKNIAGKTQNTTSGVIEIVTDAVFDMSGINEDGRRTKKPTGALIVIERDDDIDRFINNKESFVTLNADVTSSLIKTIFYSGTPLHDGATFIKKGKIYAAGVLLEISSSDMTGDLGTRHTAAKQLSERSDAIVIIVSEETGKVSLAINGNFEVYQKEFDLLARLKALLDTEKKSAKG